MKHNQISSYILPILLFLAAPGAIAQSSLRIDFVSDTQQPLAIEKIIHRTNHNTTATAIILSHIIKDTPVAVYMLGDVVAAASVESKWRHMDKFLDSCRANSTHVYGLLGNHDVMWCRKKGERNFQKRFTGNIETGYVSITDSIAVVMLNSNFKKLSASEIDTQSHWYDSTLKALDSDDAIRAIVVCCHHAPYSNSRTVGANQKVRQYFVPGFLQEKKCRLFITDHAHAFEHFKISGKDFLVIGGGGGIHQPLNTGTGALQDIASSYKPMFHYLSMIRRDNYLVMVSNFLRPDFSGIDKGYSFEIPIESHNAALISLISVSTL